MQARDEWQKLFASATAAREENLFDAVWLDFQIVRRKGEPWLLLPRKAALAARALDLYPAQTFRARIARALLRIALRARVPLPRRRIQIARADPFGNFLYEHSPCFPQMAILAGNPQAHGRRFAILLFDQSGKPSRVVKAGATPEARERIAHEQKFLSEISPNAPGIPKPAGGFRSATVCAFAMDFIPGRTPSLGENPAQLLSAWLDSTRIVHFEEIFSASVNLPQNLRAALQNASFHPAIFHGDFTPWNLRVTGSGEWVALDWERANFVGPPGWDWLHFIVQPAILVRRERAEKIVRHIERLFVSEVFRPYSQRAEIHEIVRPLAAAYFEYAIFAAQTEGLDALRAVREIIHRRWAL